MRACYTWIEELYHQEYFKSGKWDKTNKHTQDNDPLPTKEDLEKEQAYLKEHAIYTEIKRE